MENRDTGPGLYFGCGKHLAWEGAPLSCPICESQKRDYRVNAAVLFDIDVPAQDKEDAIRVAENIIQTVFNNHFSRASCVRLFHMMTSATKL